MVQGNVSRGWGFLAVLTPRRCSVAAAHYLGTLVRRGGVEDQCCKGKEREGEIPSYCQLSSQVATTTESKN